MLILGLMALLQIKHLIIDWCWQPAYEFKNKGTYGHLGGIRHAFKNAFGTFLCFLPFFSPLACLLVLALDFIIHYHIDWAKVNITRHYGWDMNKDPEFWGLTGLDQALHQLTYIILIAMCLSL